MCVCGGGGGGGGGATSNILVPHTCSHTHTCSHAHAHSLACAPLPPQMEKLQEKLSGLNKELAELEEELRLALKGKGAGKPDV